MKQTPILHGYSKNRLISVILLLAGSSLFSTLSAQGGGCDCTNCPQFMPDGFTGNFYINVDNADNPTLGQNGQGVCGVRLNFDHEYLGDLSITLTSPAGQSVTLVGPIGFFGPTDGTSWDVTFLPCGDPVSPDPGFSNQWNNNQPWGLGGTYSGTYYPSNGCLQNFNTGPVDGTWTLTVVDGQAIDVGNFYDYEIIFCDPSGIDCFSCEARAGDLLQPDVNACEGALTLDLDLPPTYTPPATPPPAGQYGYTYVIGGPGGVIQDYDPGADLSSYPPGIYTVCGLSYLIADAGDIPAPNGSLTINQLRTQLNSTSPPFCGKLTNNCVNVTINMAPEDEEETETVCAPGCFLFHGVNYCQTGDYTVNLTQNGCNYQATLHLTVVPVAITNLNEIICSGGCSTNPAFPGACAAGNYTANLTGVANCDSIVHLNLTEIAVNANIANNPVVPCGGGNVQLMGTGSTTGGGVNYLWTAANGGNITGSPYAINTTVNAAGDYQLKVCRTVGGFTCCDSASVNISALTDPPSPPIAVNGLADICYGQTLNFSITPVSGATSYTWTTPAGVTVNSGGTGTAVNVTWNSPSDVICVTANNACGPSDPTCLDINVNTAPVILAPVGPDSVCAGTSSTYAIPAVTGATSYLWTVSPPAVIASGQNTESVTIDWNGGTTANVCVRVNNSCGSSPIMCKPVTILPAPAVPAINGNTQVCAGVPVTYAISGSIPGSQYTWSVTNGVITGGNGSTTVQVTWNSGATSGQLCAVASNSCGQSTPACIDVTISQAPTVPAINGNAALCAGQNGTYSLPTIGGATGYNWSVPAGASIVSGQGTNSIVVNWSAAPGGDICATVSSSCGPAAPVCFPVVVYTVPVAQAGPDQNVCALSATLSASASVGSGIWTVAGGTGTAVFANANSPITSVTVTQYGVYVFRWTETNVSCSDFDEVTIDFNDSPNIGAITPLCDGANENYTVSFPISGGSGPYTVAGGNVTNGVFTSNTIVSGSGYSFTVIDANNCASATVTGAFNCNCASNAGTMNLSLLTACEGETVTAQHNNNAVLDANDTGAFVLHEGAGQQINNFIAQNTTGIFGWQTGMNYGQTYYISYVVGNNSGGFPSLNDICLSVSQGQPVIFYLNPVANAGIDADTCGLQIQLSGNSGAGQWTLGSAPVGGTLNFGNQNAANTTAIANTYGVYTLVWTLNVNGCTDTDEVAIDFNDSPAGGLITADCDGTNTVYTVSFPITGGAPGYAVNGTPLAGNTFTSANITSGQPYSFVITDANGCVSPAINGTENCQCSTNAGQMELNTLTACEGETVTAVQVAGSYTFDANDIGAFALHEGAGTQLSGLIATNSTGTFGFQAGMTYGQTYYVSFVAGNNLGGTPNLGDPCLSVAQGQPVIFYQNPTPDAGQDLNACGLSLDLAANGTGGVWSVSATPPGGSATLSEPGNANATLSGDTYGAYTLIWTVTANGCVGADEVDVRLNDSPQLDSLNRDCDTANENFTVTLNISGGTLPYTINGTPVGAGIYTTTPLPNGSNYSFTLVDANGCLMPVVEGAYSCNCATDAGTMSAALLEVCESTSVTSVANPDAQLDGNDITAFVLHEGNGGTIVNAIATNSTGEFGFDPATMTYGTTYYISRVAGNPLGAYPNPADPCYSVAPGQPVVWLQIPVPDAGVDLKNCGNSMSLAAVQGAFSGQWTWVNGPGASTFVDAADAGALVNVDQSGIYTFRWTETNGICTGFDEVEANFLDLPDIGVVDETCNSLTLQYTASFEVTGGTPPYSVNGLSGSFAGNIYTSTPLASLSIYNFSVTDAEGCMAGPITGTKNCNCATDAGSMNTGPQIFCDGEFATAIFNNDATLDSDDTLFFVLHTLPGSTLGQIIAASTTPQFAQSGAIQFGQTYYISAIVLSVVNGGPYISDPCLSIAPGAPVQWKALPTANLSGTTSICYGDYASLQWSGTGTYPLTLSYTTDAGQSQTFTLNSPTATLDVNPAVTTTYTLTQVAETATPGCVNDLNAAVTVTVNLPPQAGAPLSEISICRGDAALIDLNDYLVQADAGGQWGAVAPAPPASVNVQGALSPGQLAAGTYTYRYRITGTAPCPDDETFVTLQVRALPTADAGPDQTIDCIATEALVDGSGSSVGNGVSYQWYLNGNTLPQTTQTLVTQEGGTYLLTVVNQFGCTASDEMNVILDNETPQFTGVLTRAVRCFGENNGAIVVAGATGGEAPYVYELSGYPPSENGVYDHLPPGEYSMTITDANGCTSEVGNLIVTEPPLLTVDLGVDLSLKLGDSTQVQIQSAIPPSVDSIIWTPLLDPAHAGAPYQYIFPVRSADLSVTLVDTNGCRATDRIYVWVDTRRNIFVPNIFNPAGSENGVVTVYGGNDVAEIELFQIFDRWGDEIWHESNFLPNDETKGWNGVYRGKNALPGVYTWILVARFKDGEREVFGGDVTIYK